MAFEEERIRELDQHEKNACIQQKLDLAIARIENDQIQRALDKAIEGLDQEISDQDENADEEVTDDLVSQQSTSSEEDLALDDSVTCQMGTRKRVRWVVLKTSSVREG